MVIATYEAGITNCEQLKALHAVHMKAQMQSFHTSLGILVITTEKGFEV